MRMGQGDSSPAAACPTGRRRSKHWLPRSTLIHSAQTEAPQETEAPQTEAHEQKRHKQKRTNRSAHNRSARTEAPQTEAHEQKHRTKAPQTEAPQTEAHKQKRHKQKRTNRSAQTEAHNRSATNRSATTEAPQNRSATNRSAQTEAHKQKRRSRHGNSGTETLKLNVFKVQRSNPKSGICRATMYSYLSTAKVFVAGYAAVLLAVVFVAGCKKKAQVLPDNPVSPEDIKTMIGNLKSKQSIGHIADIRIPAARRVWAPQAPPPRKRFRPWKRWRRIRIRKSRESPKKPWRKSRVHDRRLSRSHLPRRAESMRHPFAGKMHQGVLRPAELRGTCFWPSSLRPVSGGPACIHATPVCVLS